MGNSSSAAAASAEPEPVDLLVMTVADVAKHNTKQDCWIILNNRVFKVTECTITNFCNKTQRFDGLTLLRNATGGMDIILEVAGKDATKDFDDVGHSNDAKPLLRKMLIGKIA